MTTKIGGRNVYPLINIARFNVPRAEIEEIRGKILVQVRQEAQQKETAWIEATGRAGPHQYRKPTTR